MRWNTDHQEMAYVLRPGETDAPETFKKLMAEANRLQDVYCGEFKTGLTGNEILGNILKKARESASPARASTRTRSATSSTSRGRSSACPGSRSTTPAAATSSSCP